MPSYSHINLPERMSQYDSPPKSGHEALVRLREVIDSGRPILGAGAGTGISAKFIEKGGADLIILCV